MANSTRIARIRDRHSPASQTPEDAPTDTLVLEEAQIADPEAADSDTADWLDEEIFEEEFPDSPSSTRPIFFLAGLAIAVWTGFFIWSQSGREAANRSPAQWAEWIVSWSVPALLVLVVAMLVLRSSRAEARRFGDAARVLDDQARLLDERLTRVNGELSLAREFLTTQSRELDFLGRGAAERIGEHAERLQALIHDNSAQVDAIHKVSTTARENMDSLRSDLPVIANAARDLTNQIGGIGHGANEQMERMSGSFELVSSLHGETEQRLTSFTSQIEGLLNNLEARGAELTTAQESRIETLANRLQDVSSRIEALDTHSQETTKAQLDSMREEIARLDIILAERKDRLSDDIAERRQQIDAFEEKAVASLAGRMASLDSEIGTRREQEIAQTVMLTEHSEAIGKRMNELLTRMEEVIERSKQAETAIGAQAGTLEERLSASRGVIGETEEELSRLTDASVRLLELIQAGAKHARADLPGAIGEAEDKLAAIETNGERLKSILFDADERAKGLSDYLIRASEGGEQAAEKIAAANRELARDGDENLARAEQLHGKLSDLTIESEQVTQAVSARLDGMLADATNKLSAALAEIERTGEERLSTMADTVGNRSGKALAEALESQGSEAAAQMVASVHQATENGRETVVYLRDQLGRINELTSNLEARIEQARLRTEEQIDGDFARRVALLTESLNSAAIDVDKMLSNDVSDTAWSAYLRGDRGIFTRRAVQLLDSKDAKEIAALYEEDSEFREHVARYIHDFEAMLRTLLATANGHSLSVTMLGSDMGKMYVALAQAIERLRD